MKVYSFKFLLFYNFSEEKNCHVFTYTCSELENIFSKTWMSLTLLLQTSQFAGKPLNSSL